MNFEEIFSAAVLGKLFPSERTNNFFEALFGDAADGAYDISLSYEGYDPGTKQLRFHLQLHERPGCCLACNLTAGLPEVFSRHPVINVAGLVKDIVAEISKTATAAAWQLGRTNQISRDLHAIPLMITLESQ